MTQLKTTQAWSRQAFRTHHRLLLGAVALLWLIAMSLTLAGLQPLLDGLDNVPDMIPAGVCLALLLTAWLWARPRVPLRDEMTLPEDYWREARVGQAGAVLLSLLDGPATLGAVWTLVSGSRLTAGVSLLALLMLAFSGPGHLEARGIGGRSRL